MKKIPGLCLLFTVLLLASCATQPARNVNPNATPEAQNLLNFLYDIQGKYILSGQHNYISTDSKYTEKVHEITGKYPVIWGSDFSFCYAGDTPRKFQHCGPLNISDPGEWNVSEITDVTPEEARQKLVQTAINKHKEGHIITLMWHCCPPKFENNCCDGNEIWAMENRPTPEEWKELVTDGTPTNTAWKEQADVIAGYLQQLQDARVPVLWRPYHEMNGVWFWWCNQKGEDGFKKLWIMMYDYFTNHHKLNNLVWVWNTNAPRDIPGDEAFAYEDFWPGIEYVDVLAADVYRKDWKQSHHDDLRKLGNGKPIALGEVGNPPTPEIIAQQPYWTWFMPWGSLVLWRDNPEVLKQLFQDDRLLTRDELRMNSAGKYKVTI